MLVTGDRIISLYHGIGTSKYPGRISAVVVGAKGTEATFSIAYDDGDKDTGMLSKSVGGSLADL